jgi:hypothetical protein
MKETLFLESVRCSSHWGQSYKAYSWMRTLQSIAPTFIPHDFTCIMGTYKLLASRRRMEQKHSDSTIHFTLPLHRNYESSLYCKSFASSLGQSCDRQPD